MLIKKINLFIVFKYDYKAKNSFLFMIKDASELYYFL